MNVKKDFIIAGLVVVLLVVFGVQFVGAKQNPNKGLGGGNEEISVGGTFEFGLSFPPMSDEQQRTFTASNMQDLGVTQLRNNFSWTWLEPSENNLDFSPVGDRLSWASNNNLSMFVTITSRAPSWRCIEPPAESGKCITDPADWEIFLDSLFSYMKQYEQQTGSLPIHAFQFENEWEPGGSLSYPGTPNQFKQQNDIMYQIAKQYFPNVPFYFGSFTRGTVAKVAFCEGYTTSFVYADGTVETNPAAVCDTNFANVVTVLKDILKTIDYDAADHHLYWDPETHWPAYIEALRNEMLPKNKSNIALTISEFGGPNTKRITMYFCGSPDPCPNMTRANINAYQDEQIGRQIEQLKTLGNQGEIEAAYLFTLVENGTFPAGRFSGLYYLDNQTNLPVEKPSYQTFKSLTN